jgi:hypothetical protein
VPTHPITADECVLQPQAGLGIEAMPVLKTRGFAGAFGRTAGTPPHLSAVGVPLIPLGGAGAWMLYAPEEGSTPASTSLSEATTPDSALLAVSGRPFFRVDPASGTKSPPDLKDADGKFSLAWMGDQSCMLATDYLGAGSVYYRIVDDTLYFADHLGLLLQVVRGPIQPNRLAIAALCIGQLQLTNETHVRGIYRLGPGESLNASLSGPNRELRFSIECDRPLLDVLTSEPAIRNPQEFDDALQQCIEHERYGPRTALMLSGGRDSRALALAINRKGLDAVTYGSKLSTDMMWARRFARRAGLTHHIAPYETWGFHTYAEAIVGLGGGSQGLQIANNLVGYDWASGKFELGIVGYMGDPTMGSHLGEVPDTPDRLFFNLLMGRPHPSDCDLAAIFGPELADMRDIILERIRSLDGLPRHQAHRILDFTIRQSTWISGMFSTCAWYLPLAYPFFHRRLLSGMFQADFDLLASQALYDRWLAFKQKQLGIRYQKSPGPERLLSLRSRLTKGMWPPTRVYWPEVYARSRDWLDGLADCGIDYLDRITHQSRRAMQPDSNADDPVMCMTIPLQLTFGRWGRA